MKKNHGLPMDRDLSTSDSIVKRKLGLVPTSDVQSTEKKPTYFNALLPIDFGVFSRWWAAIPSKQASSRISCWQPRAVTPNHVVPRGYNILH